MEEVVKKFVGDLGAAAYLLMHGYRAVGRQGREIVFEIEDTAIDEFNQRKLEYLSSEFHRFDSYLMSLKKMDDTYRK